MSSNFCYIAGVTSNIRYAYLKLSRCAPLSVTRGMRLGKGWALIRVNFDPIQEFEPKVGGGCSFEGGRSFEGFARIRYRQLWN